MIKVLQAVKDHPLVDLLLNVRGNQRICIFIEPLWGIPFNLIAPFTTLYMYALGVDDIQIGLILSIAMIVQVVFSFFGGIIADKLGRKATTILGDFLGWSVACAIWAVSQNFWFFLAAVLFNSFEQVNQTSWTCLFIEDAKEKDILNLFTWITIAGLLAVFFAPISGVLVGRFSLVPVARVIYAIYSVTMLCKCIITWRYTTETTQGKIRKAETSGVSVWAMVGEYRHLIPMIFKSRATLQTLAIMVIVYITNMINTSFFGLYINQSLSIPEGYLAFFPILRAIVMLSFMFGIQHRLQRMSIKIPMQAGLLLYIACQALLIFSPKGMLLPIIAFTLLEAVANALVFPRKDSMLAMNVDPKERARIVALLTAFMIAFSSPFGYLAGLLSSLDRRLPFLFSAMLYVIAIVVIWGYRSREFAEE